MARRPRVVHGTRSLSVKEQLRAVPRRGIGYGVLRYLRDRPQPANGRPDPVVTFNYLGQLDQLLAGDSLFRALPSPTGTRSERDRRRHTIAVEGKIAGGVLRFAWIYSENPHRRETIERLAREFEASLRDLIAQSRSAEFVPYSPTDFPRAGMSQKDLDKLVAKLKPNGPGLSRDR